MGRDLTRWNRAGLSRFRYVDANAVTHLEALRIELAARFPQWIALEKYGAPPDETATERTARILAEYRADRGDWAWETTRAFARALHILTEHIDAFANEGYLRTTTQWQSVRRLAAMVGYMPAPASSATTPLVLIAKSEVTSASVNRGFAVKHVPAGAPSVIFETLEDIDIAPVLNALRLAGWNTNAQPLTAAQVFAVPAPGTPPLWPIPKGVKVSAGGLAILATEGDAGAPAQIPAIPVMIASVMEGAALALSSFTASATVPPGLTFDTALLHVAPLQILVPILNGADVVRVSSPHDLVAGDVVAWKPGDAGGVTTFAKVLKANSGALRLQPAPVGAFPAHGAALFRAAPISFAQFTANNSEWRLPSNMRRSGDFRVTFAGTDGQLRMGLAEANLHIDTHDAGYDRLNAPELGGARQIWFADPGEDKPAALVGANLPPQTLEFDGTPPTLASGDLVILQTASGYAANRIARIEKDAGSYWLVFAAPFTGSVTAVHGLFAATVRPTGHHIDPTQIASSEFELQLDPSSEWPAPLNRNRQLVLESASGAFAAFTARIVASDPQHRTIRVDWAATELAPIHRGDLVVRANVVDAGHGETKPVRVLGSGNASATNQRFLIDVDDVSHVRDASMPGGVRADVRVEIVREIYSQVATLRNSEPADPHYIVRITETGTLELEFGDGRHGRRLPSGTNNVLATIRRGAGLGGDLPGRGAFRHRQEASRGRVLLPADRGNGRRRPRGTRPDPPERAGTPGGDGSRHLGCRLSAARPALPGRVACRRVRATQLRAQPRGGAHRHRAGRRRIIGRTRGRHPQLPCLQWPLLVDIIIEPYVALPVEISVRARVDSTQFDPREVAGRVRAAVLATFDLRLRRPGQPAYRSEVTRVVENTDGVSNSDIVLFASAPPTPESAHVARGDDAGIWAVFPRDNQVIYAANAALINITTAEATI